MYDIDINEVFKGKKYDKNEYKKIVNIVTYGYGTNIDSLSLLLIRSGKLDIYDIPIEYRSRSLYDEYVKLEIFYIKYIDSDLITEKMCIATISIYPFLINYIPQKYRNRKLYELAVSGVGFMIEYVPAEMLDKNMYELAIRSYYPLDKVPDKYKNKNMYIQALEKSSYQIKYIDKNVIDKDMCDILVSSSSLSKEEYDMIPSKFITQDLISKLLLTSEKYIKYVYLNK
jgi:hypothetical protein